MKCQCCGADMIAEKMAQCGKCLAVLCPECYRIHTHPDTGHICRQCPMIKIVEKTSD